MELFTQFSSPRQREAGAARRQRSGGVPSVFDQTRNIQQSQTNPATRVETFEERTARETQEKRLADEQRQARRRIVRSPRTEPQTQLEASQERDFVETYQAVQMKAARDALSVDADYAARASEHYTGAPKAYVRTLIYRETARTDDPKIRPPPLRGQTEPRSSAVGYGQFLDDNYNRKFWRTHLPRYMMGVETMTDEEVMSHREDGPISAAMIGHRSNQAAATLMGALGRPVTQGEVYLEHFAGAGTAVAMIREAERNPSKSITAFYHGQPQGAAIIASHPSDIRDKSGRIRTVREFIEHMTEEFPDEVYPVGKR